MKRSKKADATSIRFLIGVLIAFLIVFGFAKCVYETLLKPEDLSKKQFEPFVNQIEAVAKNSGVSTEADAAYLYVDKEELMLFFDKDENYIVHFSHEFEDSFMEENTIFNYKENQISFFKDHLKYPNNFNEEITSYFNFYVNYVFRKPSGCEGKACVVLCHKNNIKGTFFRSQEIKFSDYSFNLPYTYLITCEPKQIKIIEGVTHFYRKPFFSDVRNIEMKTEKESINSISVNGFFINSKPFNPGWDYWTDVKDSWKENNFWSGTLNFEIVDHMNVDISEWQERGWSKRISLLRGQYVNLESFMDGIVLCYHYPCLTTKDKLYDQWYDYFKSCVLNGECNVLYTQLTAVASPSVKIKNIPKETKPSENKLQFTLGEDEFMYDFNAEMVVLFESKEYALNDFSLNKDDGMLVVKLDNKYYSISKIYKEKQDTENVITKSKIIFSASAVQNVVEETAIPAN